MNSPVLPLQATAMPGPEGHWLWGHIPLFRRDPLLPLVRAAETQGDAARFRFGTFDGYFFNHPESIKHVLQDNSGNYVKSRGYRKMKAMLGNGLVTSDGDLWRQQRNVAQPTFQRARLEEFMPLMNQAFDPLLIRWREKARQNEAVDIRSEMTMVALRVTMAALFASRITDEQMQSVSEALDVFQEHTLHSIQAVLDWPLYVPTARNRRLRRALGYLDSLVYQVIRGRKVAGNGSGDLLDVLLSAQDERSGKAASDRQVRDQITTFLFAGHETSSTALTWTLYLLARHPQIEANVREEIATLSMALPSAHDFRRLPYLTMVIKESMRIYPPIWVIERESISEDVVAQYLLPRGAWVIVSPYTVHRHRDFWTHPAQFLPERFAQSHESARPAFAYIPFGAGPRNCIGGSLAWLEIHFFLIRILQHFRLSLVDNHVEFLPQITLRPKDGVQMLLKAIS